jgi:hypothetical protein
MFASANAKFARQIQGRPKTDKRDCQWIQRLHKHGLLPAIFQPDETTPTLRDYVRHLAALPLLPSDSGHGRDLFHPLRDLAFVEFVH